MAVPLQLILVSTAQKKAMINLTNSYLENPMTRQSKTEKDTVLEDGTSRSDSTQTSHLSGEELRTANTSTVLNDATGLKPKRTFSCGHEWMQKENSKLSNAYNRNTDHEKYESRSLGVLKMAESFGGGGRVPRPSGDSSQVWCLKRAGMNEEWLLLEAGSEVTIGRGAGVTYQLMSKSCPLMISRNHCVFKQNADGQWTVTDNKSLNGVWINFERIAPSKACLLQEGDFIQLGVPLKHRETPEYEYTLMKDEWKKVSPFLASKDDQLTEKMKDIRAKRKSSLEDLDPSGVEGPSNSRSKRDRLSSDVDSLGRSEAVSTELSKQPRENLDVVLLPPRPSKKEKKKNHCSYVQVGNAVSYISKDQKAPSLAQSWSGLEEIMKTLAEMTKLKAKMQEKQTAVLNVRQKNKKCTQKDIQVLEQELQDLQEQLCTEQEQQQQRVEQLEKTFCEELEGAKEEQGEEKLKEQLAQVLAQHRALMEELSRSKKDFEEIIKAKDRELKETKEEKEKARAQKEEALSQMNDVLENELQCTICSEHFIEAVTLNCAHSFCSYCIREWMKRKVECPICRRTISSKTRSLVLDNCIDRMVENLDAETKHRRLSLMKERKGKQVALESPASESESSSLTSFSDSESSSVTSTLDSETSSLTSVRSIMSVSSYESDDYEGDSDSQHVI
ncbi:PREDICTED: E3 ubiquitin-protein ligase RNF8 [Gekko japonicus]|uniref:E3 ubiquitin-protein ligase CHFR n=1 Tax=Gekko japonicus TaxID=146911 RepID=A0ABM1KFB3_GEKJA|nr:PREDICTED: E3 ubiquitin-protein ligase RNF8 [Gekko japonicus]